MAGLGTGAAPFRAFIQHRALQVSLGKRVGPMLYYFGSRHRSEEYLYGEEIEAYIKDNIITHAGLAFSRDSDSKVYIQHKMRNDGEMLANLMKGEGADVKETEKGAFYLCGPTWPVPDVFEALVNALVKTAGRDKADAEAFLERLKEEERYVLEVSLYSPFFQLRPRLINWKSGVLESLRVHRDPCVCIPMCFSLLKWYPYRHILVFSTYSNRKKIEGLHTWAEFYANPPPLYRPLNQ